MAWAYSFSKIGPALGRIQHVLGLVHAELFQDRRQLLFEDFLHPQFHAVLEDQVERLHRELLADAVHTPDPLLDPHRIPRQIVVDDDVGELQVQTFATGIGRNENAGLLCELPLDSPPLLQVHRAVEANDREAVLLQELPQHVLRRHELGEDQVLQLRVVLLPLVLVQDVEQGFGSCVRPLGLTATCQIEQQPHFLFLVLLARPAGSPSSSSNCSWLSCSSAIGLRAAPHRSL